MVSKLQGWLYHSLPSGLGFSSVPVWWPFPLLAVGGALTAVAIRFLPGTGGHSPADGLHTGGPPAGREIPGVFFAALATLAFGAVLGPEAPLIALGGGVAAWAVSRVKAGSDPQVKAVVAGTGSFAAISTLLGSPIVGAFLLMEATGLGGTALELVLVPGLLASGIGALIFVGLGHWSGLGTFSLAIPNLPATGRPDLAEFGWSLVIGVAAGLLSVGIRRGAVAVREVTQRQVLLWLPVVGLVVAGLAVAFSQATGKPVADVLFSGQSEVGPLVQHAASYSVGALVLLLACKALAYGVSMSSFRGGPIFPALFVGAVGGVAMSHLAGLSLVPAVGMGMGAMTAGILRLPMTSVLLASLLLFGDGLRVMPLVIVAVVISYIIALRLDPPPVPAGQPAQPPGQPAQPPGQLAQPPGQPATEPPAAG